MPTLHSSLESPGSGRVRRRPRHYQGPTAAYNYTGDVTDAGKLGKNRSIRSRAEQTHRRLSPMAASVHLTRPATPSLYHYNSHPSRPLEEEKEEEGRQKEG